MCDEDKTSNSVQACSDLAHVVLVLVGVRHVRRVTVVHIGLEGVLVVIHFCVAILFVNCCIRRCSLYRNRQQLFQKKKRKALRTMPSANITKLFVSPHKDGQPSCGDNQNRGHHKETTVAGAVLKKKTGAAHAINDWGDVHDHGSKCRDCDC